MRPLVGIYPRGNHAMRILLVMLFLLTVPIFSIASEKNDPVVARIGDKQFRLSDFNRWMSFGSEQSRASLEKDPKRRASMLRQIVTSMVVAEQARKQGFDQRPDIRENMELLINNFLTIEYLDKVIAQKVEVKDKDVRRYYNQHKDTFRVPERVKARHILVKVNRTAPEEALKHARVKAENILKRVKAGEDFARLASEYSDDPGSKKKGGDVGFFSRGRMAPEFERAAFSLKPGEVSDIVQTNFGFHIIKVEEKKDPSIKPYKAVKEQLRKKVEIDMKKKAVDTYVEKIIEEKNVSFDLEGLFGSGKDPHMK